MTVRSFLCQTLGCGKRPHIIKWTLNFGRIKVAFLAAGKDRIRMLIDTEQKVTASLAILTAGGQPARVDGVPTWEVEETTGGDGGDVVEIAISEDGLSATFTAVGEGTAQVTVTADADLGEGVRAITAVGTITVTPAGAATLQLAFGTPEPK